MDSIIPVCLCNKPQLVCTLCWPLMFPRQYISRLAGHYTGQMLKDCASCHTVPHYALYQLEYKQYCFLDECQHFLSLNFINVFLYHRNMDSMSNHVIRNAKWFPEHTLIHICINTQEHCGMRNWERDMFSWKRDCRITLLLRLKSSSIITSENPLTIMCTPNKNILHLHSPSSVLKPTFSIAVRVVGTK